MKLVLLLAGVLCLALIATARPQDESAEEAVAELSEDASKEDAEAEDGSTGTEGDSDSDAGGSESDESGAGDGEAEVKEDDVNGSDDGADKEGEQSEGDEAASGDAAGGDGAGGDGDGSNGDGGNAEGGGAEGGDGESSEANDGGEGDKGTDAGSDGEEEDDRVNTYNQVHSQLKKIMEVGTKDEYLKSYVLGCLQERLMNPTIDLVGTIGKYSKIKECFSSLAKDVEALVKGSDKSYEECTKDKTKTNCGSEGTRDLDEGLTKRQQELSNCIVEKRDA